MKKHSLVPRRDWEGIVADQGLTFGVDEGRPYWDESVFYEFSEGEIDRLENAVTELQKLCLEAVGHVIRAGRWDEFGVPPHLRDFVARSWDEEKSSIYGRFDLWFDGRDIKLLEYNADTPTGLIEAAVAQWHWLEAVFPSEDQFNSIHENLIEAWIDLRQKSGEKILHVAGIDDGDEDYMTAQYLRDVAQQAGFETLWLPMSRVGWNANRAFFLDEADREIRLLFKLYPWEWLAREPFSGQLPNSKTRWIEPPWKMVLSHKAILALLWELFPDHPLLLRAHLAPWGQNYARKPLLGREGANMSLVQNGQEIAASGGNYDGPFVYQELCPLPEFGGSHPVCGGWVANGKACGLGIREEANLITTNQSRFVPHVLRT